MAFCFRFLALLLTLTTSTNSLAGWNGQPFNADIKIKMPKGSDVKLMADFGIKYLRRWRILSSPTGWSPTHHRGIDFVRRTTPTLGSVVISASTGRVILAVKDECDDGVVVVKTPHRVKAGNGRRGHAYVWYLHLGKIRVKKGQRVVHGTEVGTIAPTGKPCVGARPHLHFAVSASYPDPNTDTVNPNRFWANGRGVATCWSAGTRLPDDKLALTLPLPCKVDQKQTSKRASLRPKYDGSMFLLSDILKNGDRELVRRWQRYFKAFGHYRGRLDGAYGKNTEIAVQRCAMDSRCVKPN